jgi:hypothetical protein
VRSAAVSKTIPLVPNALCGRAPSIGRAFPSHGRGRRFNPYSAHHCHQWLSSNRFKSRPRFAHETHHRCSCNDARRSTFSRGDRSERQYSLVAFEDLKRLRQRPRPIGTLVQHPDDATTRVVVSVRSSAQRPEQEQCDTSRRQQTPPPSQLVHAQQHHNRPGYYDGWFNIFSWHRWFSSASSCLLLADVITVTPHTIFERVHPACAVLKDRPPL